MAISTTASTKPVPPLAGRSKRGLKFNIGNKESFVRVFFSAFTPGFIVAIDYWMLLVFLPVNIYLFVTGICHSCPIRYAWRHWVRHAPDTVISDSWGQKSA